MTVTADVLASPALPLLLELEASGARFRVDGEQVLVSPRGLLTTEQREVFRHHQLAVRALVSILTDVGVQDRAAEFRGQLEQTPTPRAPAFVFKVNISYVKGTCFSCADRLPELRFGRCWRCSLAWRLACRLHIPALLAEALDAAKVCA